MMKNYFNEVPIRALATRFGVALLFLLGMTAYSDVSAQCDNSSANGQWPTGTVTVDPGGALTTIATNMYEGSEYSVVDGLVAGQDYEYTHAAGSYITVREGAVAGPVAGAGFSPITVNSGITGTVYIHYNVDASCAIEATGSFANTIQFVPPPPAACDNSSADGQWPTSTITVDPGGALTTIATNNYVGSEYAVVDGIVAGSDYEFTHAAGSYITVREGAVAGPVIGGGFSPLTVTAGASGTVYVHYTVDAACTVDGTGSFATTVQFIPPPPCDMSTEDGQWPTSTITVDPGGALTTIATNNYIGSEYAVVDGIVAGSDYEFTHAAGSYITVREGAVTGPVVGAGFSPLTVTAGASGTVYVHYTVDAACTVDGTGSFATTVQFIPAPPANCDNSGVDGQWPTGTITVDPGGALTEIDDNQFESGEYAVVDGIVAGSNYEFTHSAGSYITVREGAVAGPVIGSGFSPLTVGASASGTVYVHYTLDSDCNTNSSGSFVTTVQFLPPPPEPGDNCLYSSAPGSFISSTNPGGTTTDVINVAVGPEIITDLNVFVDITHTFSGDIVLTLTSPLGTSVDLIDPTPFTQICGADDDMVIEWDDEAANAYNSICPNAAPGNFMVPFELLSAFDGESIDGNWTLTVTDDAGGDDGTLNSWCLIPTTVLPACIAPTLTFNQSNTDCDDETFDWSLDIAADGDAADYDVYVNTPTMPDCGASQAPSAGFPSDPACEAAICAADSWCCTNEWDAICADAALLEPACSGCVGGSPGSSTFIGTFTGGTSGIALGNFSFSTNAVVLVEHNDDSDCNQTEPVVNTEVCGCTDPLAVNTDPGATVNNGSCIYPPANDECADAQSLPIAAYPAASNALGNLQGAQDENGLPSCGFTADSFFDVYYEFTVSEENHYIVNVDPISSGDIAVEVLDACGGTVLACGATSPFIPDCGVEQPDAGFPEDPTCQAAVCGADAFCCDTQWDGICAEAALLDFPGDCAGCLGGSPLVEEVNLLLENLTPGTYTVRVGANGTETNLSNAFFLVNVQSFPTAQVQSSPTNPLYACNQSGFQLEDFVGAEPQTTPGLGILDYEWLVAEEGGGTLTEWERGEPNYVSRCEWLGMDYGKTYNVFVRLLINHPVFGPTWGVYQGDYGNPFDLGASSCTISTASNVTPTEIRPNYTPTNAQGNDYALCDFVVAYNVSNSENFRWRFDGNGTPGDLEDIIYTRGSGNPSVRLSWVNGLIPGTTYQVAVEVQVAGNWSGYSTVLPVTLALPPNTVQLRSAWCDGSATSYVLSESVCAADTYTFEFVDQGDASVHTFTSGNYVCFLNNLSPAIAPGTYDVRVKVSQGGIAGDFGGICVVTIGGPTAPGAGEASALRDIAVNGSATLFPNPNAGDEVRVNLDGLSAGNHEVMISVYDVYGKQISTQGFGHEGESLSRLVRFDGGLAMGMYMVQIVVDGESFTTERLIVK